MKPTDLFRPALAAFAAVMLLAACMGRGPLPDAKIARAVKTGLRPGEAWIVTRLHYTQGDARNGRVDFSYDRLSDNPKHPLNGVVAGHFSVPMHRSGEAVVLIVNAGRISLNGFTMGDIGGVAKRKFTTDVKPGTITYIGDVKFQFGAFKTFGLDVFHNPPRSPTCKVPSRRCSPHSLWKPAC